MGVQQIVYGIVIDLEVGAANDVDFGDLAAGRGQIRSLLYSVEELFQGKNEYTIEVPPTVLCRL
jgi:hypothetical protein